MTFKARVLWALGVACLLTVVGGAVLKLLDAPEAYRQALIYVIGLPAGAYIAFAILREREDLEREREQGS